MILSFSPVLPLLLSVLFLAVQDLRTQSDLIERIGSALMAGGLCERVSGMMDVLLACLYSCNQSAACWRPYSQDAVLHIQAVSLITKTSDRHLGISVNVVVSLCMAISSCGE